jgi:hypothetical protein
LRGCLYEWVSIIFEPKNLSSDSVFTPRNKFITSQQNSSKDD